MSRMDRTKVLVQAEGVDTLLLELAQTAADVKSPVFRYIVISSVLNELGWAEYKSPSFTTLLVAINRLDKIDRLKGRADFIETFKTGLQTIEGEAHAKIYRMYARLVYGFNGFETEQSFTDVRDSILKDLAVSKDR